MIPAESRRVVVGGLAALLLGPSMARAQERLVGGWTTAGGLVVENWSLPTAAEVATSSGGPMYVRGITQLTIPVAAVVPLGSRWSADVYSAYATTSVRLARPAADGATRLTLSGPTDSRVRVVGRLAGDLVTVTAGVTVPVGRTALASSELDALSVAASPALGLRTPGLGAGLDATAGVLLAVPLGAWSGAAGASYEYRGAYSPTAALESGLLTGALRPGDVTHVTLGAARATGALRHTIDLAADLSAAGTLQLKSAAGDAGGGLTIRSEPSLSALYQLDVVGQRTTTSAYVIARRRGRIATIGDVYPGSARTEFEAGTQSLFSIARSATLRWVVDGRYQSMSAARPTTTADAPPVFAGSGVVSAGTTLGVRLHRPANAWSAEPFVRAQVGRLDFGPYAQTTAGTAAGLTIAAHF